MHFFFSYSHKNNDNFLRSFFEELNDEVQTRSNGDREEGFFDQRNLDTGDFWEPKLEAALKHSRVLVAAVTPGFVTSEYCAKEWGAFEARLAKYASRPGAAMPPLILPLLWIPSPAGMDWPRAVADRQYKHGNPDDIWNVKGLKHICRLKGQFPLEYTNYLEALANRIVTLGHQFADLDTIAEAHEPPTLPWGTPSATPPTAGPAAGPNRVHFIFSAAPKTEIGSSGKPNTDGYGDLGERWQPYLPAPVQIGTIARQTATLDALNLWTNEISIATNLPQIIRDVELRRELVVVFVDGWTAALPRYQQTLQQFDRENYINCSVLVPWNDADADTSAHNEVLLSALDTALHFRVTNKNPLYYRGPIRTEAELRAQLADVLTRLRAEVINKATPPPGSVPPGGARPIITGPGGS